MEVLPSPPEAVPLPHPQGGVGTCRHRRRDLVPSKRDVGEDPHILPHSSPGCVHGGVNSYVWNGWHQAIRIRRSLRVGRLVDETGIAGFLDCLRSAVRIETSVYGLDVRAHGVRGELKTPGDLSYGLPLGELSEHTLLAGTQSGAEGNVCHLDHVVLGVYGSCERPGDGGCHSGKTFTFDGHTSRFSYRHVDLSGGLLASPEVEQQGLRADHGTDLLLADESAQQYSGLIIAPLDEEYPGQNYAQLCPVIDC